MPVKMSLWDASGLGLRLRLRVERKVRPLDYIDGRLVIEPLISHRLPPEKIREAYEGLLAAPESFTGVVLEWPAP